MSDAMTRITALAQLLSDQQAQVAALEMQLSEAKAAMIHTERDALPNLMNELQLTEIKLLNGTSVKVVEDVDCAITEANRAAALAWLRDNGFGGLIKTEVKASFGRGEEAAARHAFEVLVGELQGQLPELKEAVHASTLKSFVKEQLANGTAVPFDLFSVFPFSRAKVTPAKVRKG